MARYRAIQSVMAMYRDMHSPMSKKVLAAKAIQNPMSKEVLAARANARAKERYASDPIYRAKIQERSRQYKAARRPPPKAKKEPISKTVEYKRAAAKRSYYRKQERKLHDPVYRAKMAQRDKDRWYKYHEINLKRQKDRRAKQFAENPEAVHEKQRIKWRKASKELPLYYVKKVLRRDLWPKGVPIPKAILESKQLQMKIKRTVKQQKEQRDV